MRNVLLLKLSLILFLIMRLPGPAPGKKISSVILPHLQGEEQIKGAGTHFDNPEIYLKIFLIYQNEKCSINWTSKFQTSMW